MFAKIQITGKIETVTGMHIGGSSAFAAIGAVDAPVIKDIRTGLPMLPGSSLKGKMRTLLAKEYNEKLAVKPDDDCEQLLRIFGSARKDAMRPSRVIIPDMVMENWEEIKKQGIQSKTEVKFENTIDRIKAVANPRQIERTLRGSVFPLEIIYEVGVNEGEAQIVEDIGILAEGFRLLQYDYLGGNGSRGYGKVAFSDLSADAVIGDVSAAVLEKCNQLLKESTING